MSEPKYMMDHFRGDKIRSRCTDDVRDKNFTAVKVNSQKQVQDVPE
jgi:hypothetical protein